MSMISSLIDELRELVGDGSMEWVVGPVRASVLREAADTIWELRDDLQQAHRENAKLRELVKEMRVCLEDECKRCHEWGDACDLEHQMRELGVDE